MKRLIVMLIFLRSLDTVMFAVDIKTFFAQYTRPITVLDVHDTPSKTIATYCPEHSVFVLFSCNEQHCFEQNWIHFKAACSAEYLTLLAECEYFDVVLIPDQYVNGNIFAAVCALADYVCIDYASPKSVEQEQVLINKECTEYSSQDGKQFTIVKTNRLPFLKKRNICWDMPTSKLYNVISTFSEKMLLKQDIKTSKTIQTPWIAGINLLTAIYCGLALPNKLQVIKELEKMQKVLHLDWGPANMILAGSHLMMIDWEDFHYDGSTVAQQTILKHIEKRYKKLLVMMELSNNEIINYYWDVYHTPCGRFIKTDEFY